MFGRKAETPPPAKKVGGLFFFTSLFSAVLLACAGVLLLPATLRLDVSKLFSIYLASALLGSAAAGMFIRNRLSVFLHEFKHYVVSNLAGNRSKGMVYRKRDGHFTYQYSKDTAHLNAFISLAPYVLPLFSIAGIVLGFSLWRNNPILLAAIIGFGFGIDQLLNWRDVSPIQTDFSNIRGGFGIGLIYVISSNVITFVITSVLATHGPDGLLDFGREILLTIRAAAKP